MDWQGWFTIAVIVAILLAMILELASPDLNMMAGHRPWPRWPSLLRLHPCREPAQPELRRVRTHARAAHLTVLMRSPFRFPPRLPFNTKLCHRAALAIGCGIAFSLLACTTPGESADQAKPKFSTQLLGQSDYPTPGQMTYRPPRILLEAEGVRVVFDLVNGRPYSLSVVILKITLLGPSGERRSQEIYVGPMLARETKRVSVLVENIDFTPDDLVVELLTKH